MEIESNFQDKYITIEVITTNEKKLENYTKWLKSDQFQAKNEMFFFC